MICLALCLLAQTAQAKLPAFKHYVIFGDSLTDVGNYTTSSNNCIYFNAPITNHTKDFGGPYVNTTWANAGEQSASQTPRISLNIICPLLS